MSPGFLSMRASLVERGLIDPDCRLTGSGHAYVDELLIELATAEATITPDGPRVHWNTKGRGLPPKVPA